MHANGNYASGTGLLSQEMNRGRGKILSKWRSQEGLSGSGDKRAGPAGMGKN